MWQTPLSIVSSNVDALGLQVGARCGDVADLERDRHGVGAELDPEAGAVEAARA